MARSIRIEYPGAFYHVMARGNRREAIFKDDATQFPISYQLNPLHPQPPTRP